MPGVRQRLQSQLGPNRPPKKSSPTYKTASLRILRQRFLFEKRLRGARTNSHRRKTVSMSIMRQVFWASKSFEATRGHRA